MIRAKHYVALLEYDGTLTYVTAVDNHTHSAEWEAGKPAIALSANTAEDVAFGLNYNGYKAVIIKAPDFYNLKNKEA